MFTSSAEIYLVDDCFEKYQSKSALKLFYSVFKNCLGKKTIFYTSRTEKYMQYCDSFAVIRDGRLIEKGS